MLEELDLSLEFKITPLAGKVLGENIGALSQLKTVNLSRCDLFGEAFVQVMDGIKSARLDILNLSGNQKLFKTNAQAAVKALCEFLAEQRDMQVLDLRDTGLTTDVSQMMVKEANGTRFFVAEVKTDACVDAKIVGNVF